MPKELDDSIFNRIVNNIEYMKKSTESINHIREWLSIMENEPEGYIKISEVYHTIRRMIGDEE